EKPLNPEEYKLVNTMDSLNELVDRIYENGQVAISFQTEGEESTAELIALGLAVKEQETFYLPLRHVDTQGLLRTDGSKFPDQIDFNSALQTLQRVFEDNSILKIGQNIKFLVKLLARQGIKVEIVDDIEVISFVANEGNHKFDLAKVAATEFEFKAPVISDLLGTGKNASPFSHTNIYEAAKYSATTADIILRVWKHLRTKLIHNKVSTVYETLERPLIGILAEMEETGIVVDPKKLEELSGTFQEELTELAARIYAEAGEEFLISSPKQLGTVLFDKLQLPSDKAKTASGYKTGVDILEDLTDRGHKLPGLVLDWRHKAKLKSTYTDALQTCINPNTGRVHTSYRLDGANTGRLASINPNLQNIPIRTSEGKQIREAFVAREGYEIVSLDYSQIELRILAYMANVKGMKIAFREKMDIHQSTASQVFEIPLGEVSSDMRRKAKAINFGIIYGISAFGLARNLQIPRKEASNFIEGYFSRYPEIKQYMEKIVGIAEQQNHVKTLFGRKVGTPSINKGGPQKAFARRAAINAPIQGSAADIIRRAMVRIPDVISKLPAKLLLQIHDELLFEVRKDAVPDLIEVATKKKKKADRPVVAIEPGLVVDSGVGKNWLEAH
ncbi:MAG: DNA polymerase, partial [Rhodobacteraceae bacterium]|nr:DNA polymerase [Paracoccaceae bacterium]